MNPSSEDVKDMLEAESAVALTFEVDLFIGSMPDEPDNCVCIYDTPGRPPQLTLGTYTNGENYFYPSVQIRVRDREYVAGYSVIDSIKTLLHGRANETWNGTLYTAVLCSMEPAFLNWGEQRRTANFVTTFNIQRR